MPRDLRAAALAVLLAAAPAAGADGSDPVAVPAPDPVLDALVAEALQRSPDLEALRQSVQAARQQPAQARALADPALSVSYTNDGWSPSLGSMPMTTLAFMASQDLPWPGKRDLRGQIAEKGALAAEQVLARGQLSVAAEVRRAYTGLQQARALTALVGEEAELWKQIEGVARARYAVGQGNQQDVLRTQLEQTRILQRLAEQRLEEEVRLAELNRLRARPAGTPVDTPAELGAGPPPEALAAVLPRLQALSPELAEARLAVERARLQGSLAHKDYAPDLAIQGGYMNRGGLDPMWQAGVSVGLPVQRGRRAAAVAEAEARLRAAEALLAARELQLAQRTQERLAAMRTAQEIVDLYRGGIVPQARMSVEAAVASYETGRVPFVSVLEALTTLYGDRAALARVMADEERARASLEEASLEATPGLTELASVAASGSSASMTTGAVPAAGMSAMGNR